MQGERERIVARVSNGCKAKSNHCRTFFIYQARRQLFA
jgi:hypothetical protein